MVILDLKLFFLTLLFVFNCCKNTFQNVSEEGPSLTPINLHILRNLWLPDVEILDLKAFETHSVLSKLEG